MERARDVIAHRVAALGFPNAVVDLDLARRLLTIRFPEGRTPGGDAATLVGQQAELRFRLVQGTIPYSGTNGTCKSGKLVTPDVSSMQVVLPDLQKTACYLLGPTILTGRNVGSATAVINPTWAAWTVNVHFKNDDFVRAVATPYVNQQVAIELDGIVQSAPKINPGITGQDVTISGTFSSKQAHQLALVLSYGSLPVHLELVSVTPAA